MFIRRSQYWTWPSSGVAAKNFNAWKLNADKIRSNLVEEKMWPIPNKERFGFRMVLYFQPDSMLWGCSVFGWSYNETVRSCSTYTKMARIKVFYFSSILLRENYVYVYNEVLLLFAASLTATIVCFVQEITVDRQRFSSFMNLVNQSLGFCVSIYHITVVENSQMLSQSSYLLK